MIEAKVICDSINKAGVRLTTMQLEYPRFIHSEFMTHRVFSRNASSSRAIPLQRVIEDVRKNPAKPVYWGVNKKGMQADEEMSEQDKKISEYYWRMILNNTITLIEDWLRSVEKKPHKQIVNRLLEPWMHIRVVVSSTEWDNFFTLRLHKDAQPEMQALARAMKDALDASVPRELEDMEWHMPYVLPEEMDDALEHNLIRSAARCARVSYKTFDSGDVSPLNKDCLLVHKLLFSKPEHASPFEHVAVASAHMLHPYQLSNFDDTWVQLRHHTEMKQRIKEVVEKWVLREN